jgi:hypothetical protein
MSSFLCAASVLRLNYGQRFRDVSIHFGFAILDSEGSIRRIVVDVLSRASPIAKGPLPGFVVIAMIVEGIPVAPAGIIFAAREEIRSLSRIRACGIGMTCHSGRSEESAFGCCRRPRCASSG